MQGPQSIDFEDRHLVKRYLDRRDEAAFRALYRRHTPALYAVAVRLMGGAVAEAEDIVQEAWLRGAQKLHEFRWEATLRTWLVGIALNCARNRLRKRRADHSEDLAEIRELSAATRIESTIDPIDMQRAIEALPDGYREILILHDVFGHTHDEVAEMLGIAAGTSKSQLARARSTIRRRLERSGGDNHVRRSQ